MSLISTRHYFSINIDVLILEDSWNKLPWLTTRNGSYLPGNTSVPSLIAVAPQKTVKTAAFAGARRKLWTCSKLPQGHRGLGQSAVGSPRHRHHRCGTAMTAVVPYKNCSSTSITAVPPQYNRCAIAKKSRIATLRRSRGGSTAVNVWRVGENY